MASISVIANTNDRAALVEARNFLDQVLSQLGRTPATQQVNEPGREEAADADALADLFVENLWNRIGSNLREMVAAAETFEGEFTLADLAKKLNQERSVIQARFAKFGRSEKAAREAVPGAPQLLNDRKPPGDLWHFSMPPAIREAVRKQDVDAPRSGRAGR